ncbi:MAG: hypothetical protein SNJ29_11400 [Rikenellaceae bacterium]
MKFTIGTVPVVIVVSTHLCKIASIEAESQIEFSTGGYLHSTAQIGLHYTGSNTEPFETFELDYGLYDPVLSASGSVTAIGSLYPKFDFSIYNILGPWVEPMPYLKEEIKVGMNYTGAESSMVGTSDGSASATRDYYGWKSEGYSGMMYRVGLELSCFGYTNEIYKSDIIEAQEKLLFEVPSKIELVSPSNYVDIVAEETYNVTFQTLYYNGITDEYSPCAGAVVSDDDSSMMPSDTNGNISVSWTAESVSDILYMGIIDAADNDISSAFFPISQDRENLIKLYNSAGGANWTRNDNWCTDAPLNEWYGITADEYDHVTKIVLSVDTGDGTYVGNNVTGHVVISGFKYLEDSRYSINNIILDNNTNIETIEIADSPNVDCNFESIVFNKLIATNCSINDNSKIGSSIINAKGNILITNCTLDHYNILGENIEVSGSNVSHPLGSLSATSLMMIDDSDINVMNIYGDTINIISSTSSNTLIRSISGTFINITNSTMGDGVGVTGSSSTTIISSTGDYWVAAPSISLSDSNVTHINGDVYLLSNSYVGDYYFSYFYGTSSDYAELFR